MQNLLVDHPANVQWIGGGKTPNRTVKSISLQSLISPLSLRSIRSDYHRVVDSKFVITPEDLASQESKQARKNDIDCQLFLESRRGNERKILTSGCNGILPVHLLGAFVSRNYCHIMSVRRKLRERLVANGSSFLQGTTGIRPEK